MECCASGNRSSCIACIEVFSICHGCPSYSYREMVSCLHAGKKLSIVIAIAPPLTACKLLLIEQIQ